MNCFLLLLWIFWALGTILFHWLHSIWCYFLFYLQHVSAQLDPPDLESGDLVACTTQSLCSPPFLPPPAPGVHSALTEELNCWTLWIASQWDKNVLGFEVHCGAEQQWSSSSEAVVLGWWSETGCGFGCCCSGVPGAHTVGPWREKAFQWQAKVGLASLAKRGQKLSSP